MSKYDLLRNLLPTLQCHLWKDVPGFKNRNLIAERLIEGEFMLKYDLLQNLLPTLQWKDVPGFKNRNLIAERLIEGEFNVEIWLAPKFNLLPTLQCHSFSWSFGCVVTTLRWRTAVSRSSSKVHPKKAHDERLSVSKYRSLNLEEYDSEVKECCF